MIGIEGCIQTRRYQDRDGNNRTAFEVVANNVQFVESKRSTNTDVEGPDPLPQIQENLANAGFSSGNNSDFTVTDDDDLPF